MSRILPLIFLFAAISFSSCAKYAINAAHQADVDKAAPLAVAVVGPGLGPNEVQALEGFLITSIASRGYNVKALRSYLLVEHTVLEQLLPEGPYSITSAIAQGFEQGGSMETSPEAASDLLNRNELTDSQLRLEAMVTLYKQFPEKTGVKYLLCVYQFDSYGYVAYTVSLAEGRIIGSLVFSGNKQGFAARFGKPRGGQSIDASEGDGTRFEYLKLAEFIASNL